MMNIDTNRIGVHIISDTAQEVSTCIMPGFYKLETDGEKLVLTALGDDPIDIQTSKDDLDRLIGASEDGNRYTINIVREGKINKGTKVNTFITMHNVESCHLLHSIELYSKDAMDCFLDHRKSETHILTVESVFSAIRASGAKLDTVVKFKNMDKFYLIHEADKIYYETDLKAGDMLSNVTLIPIKDGANISSEGIIMRNISKKYPAIIKYAGMAKI